MYCRYNGKLPTGYTFLLRWAQVNNRPRSVRADKAVGRPGINLPPVLSKEHTSVC